MPVHRWSAVDASLYHHFHQQWSIAICNALNAGLLSRDYSALIEQYSHGLVPDILTVERISKADTDGSSGGVLLASPPQTRHIIQGKKNLLAARANHVVVKHRLGEVVALIEIVSPGNKASRYAIQRFVNKAVEFLEAGVSLLIVDLFPPTKRDPQGIHQLIWNEIEGDASSVLPDNKPFTLVSYAPADVEGGHSVTAFLEPVGLGDLLPDMPLYLNRLEYVPVPLEKTYQHSWDVSPAHFREVVANA